MPLEPALVSSRRAHRWRRLAIVSAISASLAGGLLTGVPLAMAADPSASNGPNLSALPEVDPGNPMVPSGLGAKNEPADARLSPLPNNEKGDEPPSELPANERLGDGAGGDVELPPHVGEERETPAPKFDRDEAELVNEDASTRTYENPDGSFTVEASADVARVQDDDGDWHEIDLSLDDEDDRVETETALVPVSIATSAEDPLAQAEASKAEAVTFDLKAATRR